MFKSGGSGQSTYFRRSVTHILVFLSIVSVVIYLSWRTLYTIPFAQGWQSLLCGLALLLLEFYGALELFIYYFGALNIKTPKLPEVSPGDFPDVDVFITTYNEETELLKRTIIGCKGLSYPDKDKLHIYLLDDGNRKEMRALAKAQGINYIARTSNKNAKAGNLNNALEHSASPLVANFDADMIPSPDFLLKTVPYFLQSGGSQVSEGSTGAADVPSPKIGFVQTPQSFYRPDIFQWYLFSGKRTPHEQAYFYQNVEPSRNKNNAVIYGGTNAVLSREALLEVGGFYTKSITEDFATGILIQSKGYTCYALTEVLAQGLPPETIRALAGQRKRWARGCIQTGRRLHVIFRKGLTVSQKLSYFSSVTYWYFPFRWAIFWLIPVLVSLTGLTVARWDLSHALMLWLPMFLLTALTLSVLSSGMRSVYRTSIYETILTPLLFVSVFLEFIGITERKFNVTQKNGGGNDGFGYRLRVLLPYLALALITGWGIVHSVNRIFVYRELHWTITLFWLAYNFYFLLASIFFAIGRRPFEADEADEAAGIDSKMRSRVFLLRKLVLPALLAFVCIGVSVPTVIGGLSNPKLDLPKMERGINIGNALDSPKDENWGVQIENRYFNLIEGAGFDHVRIPVRISDYTDEKNDHEISPALLEKLDEHIDYALACGLTVTLDLHHFEGIMRNPAAYEGEFYRIWEQLAKHYKGYPKELTFELLNEPTDMLDSDTWNRYLKGAIERIRPDHPKRLIIVGSTSFYSGTTVSKLELPRDPYLMLAFHYYEPNPFCFQGLDEATQNMSGSANSPGIDWEGTDEQIKEMQDAFDAVALAAKEKGVRVTLNEFGVTKFASESSRARYLKQVCGEAEKRGFAWCYWELASHFGIYDPDTNKWDDFALKVLTEQ